VVLWAVQGREVEIPAGVEPLVWLLLTTIAVQTVADVMERVAWSVVGGWKSGTGL
jgi:hypothetical protein